MTTEFTFDLQDIRHRVSSSVPPAIPECIQAQVQSIIAAHKSAAKTAIDELFAKMCVACEQRNDMPNLLTIRVNIPD